ncbi:MAG TPA: hypothetical protein VJA21_05575 [Verrucomicrobiae bacterium]
MTLTQNPPSGPVEPHLATQQASPPTAQLPNEPSDAHQAFLLFTRTRSIRAVARTLSLGRDKVAGWSQKYRWRGRLAALHASRSPGLINYQSPYME